MACARAQLECFCYELARPQLRDKTLWRVDCISERGWWWRRPWDVQWAVGHPARLGQAAAGRLGCSSLVGVLGGGPSRTARPGFSGPTVSHCTGTTTGLHSAADRRPTHSNPPADHLSPRPPYNSRTATINSAISLVAFAPRLAHRQARPHTLTLSHSHTLVPSLAL